MGLSKAYPTRTGRVDPLCLQEDERHALNEVRKLDHVKFYKPIAYRVQEVPYGAFRKLVWMQPADARRKALISLARYTRRSRITLLLTKFPMYAPDLVG